MAFDVNIFGVCKDYGKYSLKEVKQYLRSGQFLMADPRFRNVSQMEGYLDYAGVFTGEEILAIAKEERERNPAYQSPEEKAEWSDYKERLEKALYGASFVIIHISEWESFTEGRP